MNRTLFLVVVLLLPMMPASSAAATHQRSGTPNVNSRVVPGVIVVKLRSNSSLLKGGAVSSGSLSAFRRLGVLSTAQMFPAAAKLAMRSPVAQYGLDRIYYARINPSADPQDVAARVSRFPGVEYAEPKYMQTMSDTPNDPFYGSNQALYLALMHVPDAWSTVKTNGAVIVADVDGGTYWQHEDLTQNLWINSAEDINHNSQYDPTASTSGGDIDAIDQDGDGFVDDVIGWNFVTNSGNPIGSSATPGSAAHGTATASHIGAVTNNGIGMAGSAWNCKLMPINAGSSTSDNAIEFGYEGIQFAASHGAKVINCSWGRTGEFSLFEHDVVAAAAAAGALIVAAAANGSIDNDFIPNYPSSFKEVLGVGATNSTDATMASFTNYGISVPVYAPGVSIWSAFNGGGYGNGGSGTSYSSPLTGGLAALLFTQHPTWTPSQVATQIRVTADPIDAVNPPEFSGELGHGLVNYLRAVTESHPGLKILSTTNTISSGRDFIVPGDSVRISVTLQNILPQAANNVQFTLTSSDGALRIISGTANVASLQQSDQITLPDFVVHADSITGSRTIVLALRWVSNSVDADAYALPFIVFSAPPVWRLHDTPAASSLFSVKAVDASVLWAAGGNGSKTAPAVVRSVNGGSTWDDVTGSLSGMDLYCVAAIDSLHAWVGTGDGRIFATTNGGASWNPQAYQGTQSPFIDGIWFFDAQNGRALGDPPGGSNFRYVILTTADGGQTWNHVLNEPTGLTSEAGWNNSWWWTDSQHGWFGTNQARAWRTTNGGSTWSSASTSSQNSIGIAFEDQLRGTAAYDDGNTTLTRDGGVTWSAGSALGVGLAGIAYVPGKSTVWAAGQFSPFHSVDTGRTWAQETTFPFTGTISHISAVDPSHAWAATSFGQILSYIPVVTSIPGSPSAAKPVGFALSQNYPNPFNPSTVVEYQLPVTSKVTLAVYDVLGRRVAVLVDGLQQQGAFKVRWDAAGFASGVYFARLQADAHGLAGEHFTQVRKLVLIR